MTEPEKVQNAQGNKALALMSALTLVFVILKLTHVTDWSWWAVTAPLWVPLSVGFIAAMVKP